MKLKKENSKPEHLPFIRDIPIISLSLPPTTLFWGLSGIARTT
jgi:hypothetical protein